MKLYIWVRSIYSFICSLIDSYSETHSQMEETEVRQIMRAVEVCRWRRKFLCSSSACYKRIVWQPQSLVATTTNIYFSPWYLQGSWGDPGFRWVRFWSVLVSLFLGPRLKRLSGANSSCGRWQEYKKCSQTTQAHLRPMLTSHLQHSIGQSKSRAKAKIGRDEYSA